MNAAPVRTRALRQIAADPTSTALLLAGPSAIELWPGVRRLADLDGKALVELGEGPRTAAVVRALPPRRTATSYVTSFEWSGSDLPTTTGTLRLDYSGRPGSRTTSAVLLLESRDLPGSLLDGKALAEMANGFLLNLARVAEGRSRAA